MSADGIWKTDETEKEKREMRREGVVGLEGKGGGVVGLDNKILLETDVIEKKQKKKKEKGKCKRASRERETERQRERDTHTQRDRERERESEREHIYISRHSKRYAQ